MVLIMFKHEDVSRDNKPRLNTPPPKKKKKKKKEKKNPWP